MEDVLDEDVSLLTLEESQQIMKENFIKNAKEKPWGWEWKYTTAYQMLVQERNILDIKNMLGLSTAWLLRHKLITWSAYDNCYVSAI